MAVRTRPRPLWGRSDPLITARAVRPGIPSKLPRVHAGREGGRAEERAGFGL